MKARKAHYLVFTCNINRRAAKPARIIKGKMCEHINIDKPAHKQHKTKKTTKLLNKFFLHIYDPRNIYIYI